MARRFQRVAVLMGGPSAEREVSLTSGAAVAAALRGAGYEVSALDVRSETFELPARVEAVFIALHGGFGEDGRLQRRLDGAGLPYTGSGPEASALCMDKRRTRERLAAAGLPVAPGVALREAPAAPPLPLPVVVKPVREGSSVGCHRVFRPGEWDAAVRDALAHGGEAVCEAFIPGRELTVGVVGGRVLPAVEIRAPGGEYSYAAKYTGGLTEYLAPAPLEPAEAAGAARIGGEAFRVLGCRGMGRVDLRMDPRGRLFVLELNTIPGFTVTSLLPKAAACAGMDFAALCDCVLNLAGNGG